jgi:cell division protein FtsI/penicillin-binding protein 2
MRNPRASLIFILIFIFGATIIGRLFYIQILKHDDYLALAKGQQVLFESISPNRGDIFVQDKNKGFYILATNKDSIRVFAIPKEIFNKEEAAEKLSKIINLEKDKILEKLKREENAMVLIKEDLTKNEEQSIKDLKINGIYSDNKKLRYYPENEFCSNILGFLGGEGIGQYGVEAFYDEELRGQEGLIKGEKSSRGDLVFFDSKKSSLPEEGFNVVLNIDFYVQLKAEELLKKAKEDLDIENGQIVVMDPKTGKIMALASFLNFNPNEYSKYDFSVFINPVSQKIFEPGSVFKPITMAIGLEEGKITPQTTYVDEGFVKVGTERISNYDKRVYGECTMTEVLEKSINTGAVFVEEKIPHDVFLAYIKKFGIFDKTNIDLQSEVFSNNEELKKGYELNFVTAAFGQGVEMTPIQLVRAFSVIANGGKLIKPYLTDSIIKKNGESIDIQSEVQNPSVISQSTASKVTAMLVSVVENGFGKKAKVPGYYIAGKTGTAQASWSSLGISKAGYSDKTVQSFIGFAPAFDPKFLILVKLDNPKAKTAEYSAVPIFHDLAKYMVDYYQIPPDYED